MNLENINQNSKKKPVVVLESAPKTTPPSNSTAMMEVYNTLGL
jgi:hypothetical protein